MKIISVVGARPQFVKLFPLSRELRKQHTEMIVHTGQHFDHNMSEIFFRQMGIPAPDIDLELAAGSHAEQTGRMLIELEKVYLQEHPDLVIVFGDTNTTLAGALAASKLHIPVMHIEAGLRSGDMQMPEEQNRIIVDRLAKILCCPCRNAVDNLLAENITGGVHNTGDIMFDAILLFTEIAAERNLSAKLPKQALPGTYCLLTLHRPSNTDQPRVLQQIIQTLGDSPERFLFPAHPRVQRELKQNRIELPANIQLIQPVGYLEMLQLIKGAKKVVTDSGGLQKEALFLDTPCITLRDTTEWVETVQCGWNRLVMSDRSTINRDLLHAALTENRPTRPAKHPYGTGKAAQTIAGLII